MFLLIGKILSLSFVNITMEIMSLLYYLLNRGIMSLETMSPSAMGIRTYSLHLSSTSQRPSLQITLKPSAGLLSSCLNLHSNWHTVPIIFVSFEQDHLYFFPLFLKLSHSLALQESFNFLKFISNYFSFYINF